MEKARQAQKLQLTLKRTLPKVAARLRVLLGGAAPSPSRLCKLVK